MILIIALFREILGTGGITIGVVLNFLPFIEILPLKDFAISLFTMPAGAFLVLGIVLSVIAMHKNKKEEKIKYQEKAAKIDAMRQAVKEG